MYHVNFCLFTTHNPKGPNKQRQVHTNKQRQCDTNLSRVLPTMTRPRRMQAIRRRTGAVGAAARDNGGVPPHAMAMPVDGGNPQSSVPFPSLLHVQNPTRYGEAARMQQHVLHLANSMRPENSKEASDSRMQEYFEFIDHIESNQNPYRHVLQTDFMYKFMFYQVFREQKKRGGNRELSNRGKVFDSETYDAMMEKYREAISGQESASSDIVVTVLNPKKPISRPSFDQYKHMLRLLHKHQITSRVCGSGWEQLWTMHFKELQDIVDKRKVVVARANYEEKLEEAFSPYLMVEKYNVIEEELWQHGRNHRRSAAAGIRYRYSLLQLTSALLRCESLHRAELSDMFCLDIPKRPKDIDPIFIQITQLSISKTGRGKPIYSRATRHNDVRLCCVGALAFYLQYRFWVTGEFKGFTKDDWLDNKKWFDVKLLVDIFGSDFNHQMKNDYYGKTLKAILKKLGLNCKKLLHLGRNIGAKLLEFLEEEIEEVRRMGQWDLTIFDNHYSGKIPLSPIMKLAGFLGLYQLRRGNVDVPEELLRLSPIGEWCYDAYNNIKDDYGDHETAFLFLKFMKRLNSVTFQDAAEMIVKYPERKNHVLFSMPCFQSQLFNNYIDTMKAALATDNIELDATVESVLPGVQQNMQNQTAQIVQLQSIIQQVSSKQNECVERIGAVEESVLQRLDEKTRQLAAGFIQVGSSMLGGNVTVSVDDLVGKQGNEPRQFVPPNTHDDANIITPPPSKRARTQARKQEIAAKYETYQLKPKHQSLKELYDEWNGRGEYHGKPIVGGPRKLESEYKASWRPHLSAQHVSRTKRLVEAINNYVDDRAMEYDGGIQNFSVDIALDELEPWFKESNCTLYKMTLRMQAEGYMKIKRKGVKKNRNEVDE